jgi:hypothetical protein
VAVVERSPGTFIDVLDRVLDKGIVIDAWGRVSLVGVDLVAFEAWVVVASIDTYLRHADALGLTPRAGTGAAGEALLRGG